VNINDNEYKESAVKATLEFNLPEEQEEYEITRQAYKMHSAFWTIGNEVFRPARKHGYSDERLHALIHHLDQAAAALGPSEEGWPSDEYGPLGATDLIHLLEQKYHDILRENGVEL
jgi:hypothetical protein